MFARFPILLALAGRWRTMRFAALVAIAAACEGVGIVLLVPLLNSLGGANLRGMMFPDWSLKALLAIFVALVAARALVETFRSMAAFDLQVRVVDGLRDQAVRALLGAEWRALSQMRQSASRALLITSVDRAGEAMSYLTALVRTAMALIALFAAAILLSPEFALASAFLASLALLLLGTVRNRASRLGSLLTARHERVHLRLEEALGALRLIKSFGREDSERRSIGESFAGLRQAEGDYLRATAISRALLQLGVATALALVVWLAVEKWQVAPSYLVAFAALALRAVPLIESLQLNWQGWNHCAPAIDEAQTLAAGAFGAAEALAEGTPPLAREIALVDASVAHGPRRVALQAVTLTIPRGSIASVEGPSGAGKSTLADLLGGLISPDHGNVLLDGVPLAGGLRNGWRARVAYVQQEAVLFTGTIRENLLWAHPEASNADLDRALSRAAADFVRDLPEGLDHRLGEGGRNLSGGERQRIALARALLRDPDLLILDEATSAVDRDSERAIADAISALAGERTILVLGHRGALVDAATLRFHLRQGKLQEG